MDDPDFIGDWHRERKLGSGGFGTVMLWKHRQTGQKVAIKKCHMLGNLPVDTADKQKERWNREIELMNEMTHENIVHGVKVQPESFLEILQKTVLMPGMPILVMEYCEGGDLRQYLNAPTNVSGLIESDVRNCLRCIGNAIRYLHEQKITHRDIKPENIVINRNDRDEICFKLTDLGYAKSLDRNSLQASLVGTIEYVAPELFLSDKYSCTVDYWSFGIIAFEIVTGIRPFVPHMSLAQCLITVKKKTSEHIAITENNNGDIQFLTTIFRESHVSSAFMKLLEKWLILALEWAPKQRGHIFETQTQPLPTVATAAASSSSSSSSPATKQKSVSFANVASPPASSTIAKPPVLVLKLFTMLDDILALKIISVFSLHTSQYLSYIIDASTTMSSFRAFIENDTGIPAGRIRFTIDLENSNLTKVEPNTRPLDLYIPNYYDKPMVYVSQCGETLKPRLEIPKTLQEILENPKQKLKIHIYKRFAYNTQWFIRMEQQKYIEMLNGWYTCALQLNHECIEHEPNVRRMILLIYGLNGASTMYRKTIEEVQKNFENLNAELMKSYWMEQSNKIIDHVSKLIVAADKIQQRYRSALRRSHEATKNHLFGTIVQDYFNVRDFDKLFDIVRTKIAKKETNDIKDLVMRAYQCLKHRDQLLMDKEFIQWQKQISDVEIEMEEITKAIDMAIVQGEKYRDDLYAANKLFQAAISNGVKRPIPVSNEYIPDIEMLQYSLSNSIENGNAANNAVDPIIASDLKKLYGSDALCFGESDDALSLMEDNEQLRVTMEGLIKDIDVELSESLPIST